MNSLRSTALLFLPLLASASALASGNHASGHDHHEAIGIPGVVAKVTRVIRIDMTDNMRFTPADISTTQNETVRFVIKNSGALKHELVLGTEEDLKKHYEVMKRNPGMEHADSNMVTLAPGQSGEIVWQFTRPGKVDFACLQPGHYDAGMKGVVNVSKVSRRPHAN